MKSIIKGFVVAALMLSFAAAASAEEASKDYTEKSDNISFNYGKNTFSVTDTTNKGTETELTVMLVKGDYSSKSLAEVAADDICYIGQAGGLSYSNLFNNLGVKYTGGKFEPGVYTLVTSGYGAQAATKTRIFLGNAVDSNAAVSEYMHSEFKKDGVSVNFGTMSQTLKIQEAATSDRYIYVGVGEFNIAESVTTDKLGFVVQKQEAGKDIQKGYRSLSDFGITALENVGSLSGVLNVGIQINGLANTTEIVAIPYVIAQ